MGTKQISFSFKEFNNENELEHDEIMLVRAARKITGKAYAPYSGFNVGAAVLLKSGIIVSGTNVENAAFTSGICAERNALANAIISYPDDEVTAIAIAANTVDGFTREYISPCGDCRQFILEEESRKGTKIKIILAGIDKYAVIDSISYLLPLQFGKNNLNTILP